MTKEVSRILSLTALALALIAVFMALRAPNDTLVLVSEQDAKFFDDKILSLEQAHQQGVPRTARITETEMISEARNPFLH